MTTVDPVARAVRAKVWDVPTRVCHWLLVALLGFSWWSAETGNLEWHRWSGYAVIEVLVFRIYWGFVGPATARFSGFVRGPAAVLAYAKSLGGRASPDAPGHNPLGALSVLAILLVLTTQVVTGLFAVDVDGIESGPLSDRVDFDTGRVFADIHHWSFTILQILVVLHLAAIAYYLIRKRRNLVGAMITGQRRFEIDPGLVFAPVWRIVPGAILAVAIAAWVSKGLRF